MKELKERLSKELQQDFNVKIMDSIEWSLPVHSIEIAYETVKRTKMDILMKMMLIAFQKARIETTEELSDILLVEPLFIQDLIDKLTSARVIEKKEGTFALTDIGVQQLAAGIFDHEPENNTIKMLYSPCHQAFLHAELNGGLSEELEVYRYLHEVGDWHVTSLEQKSIRDALKMKGVETNEGNAQVVVSKIKSATDRQIDSVLFIEFHLYNVEEDAMYARVWNTLSEQWDETIEAELNEKERKVWREKYLSSETPDSNE